MSASNHDSSQTLSLREPDGSSRVEFIHARASLSWERVDPADAAAFDTALRQLLLDRVGDAVELAVRATIVWGKSRRWLTGRTRVRTGSPRAPPATPWQS